METNQDKRKHSHSHTNQRHLVPTLSCLGPQGYFQLKANPGAWSLKMRKGRSDEIYKIYRWARPPARLLLRGAPSLVSNVSHVSSPGSPPPPRPAAATTAPTPPQTRTTSSLFWTTSRAGSLKSRWVASLRGAERWLAVCFCYRRHQTKSWRIVVNIYLLMK